MNKLYAVLCSFALCFHVQAEFKPKTKDRKLADNVMVMACKLLSPDTESAKGLMLLKFAKRIDKENSRIVLTEHRLKNDLPIPSPKGTQNQSLTISDLAKEAAERGLYYIKNNDLSKRDEHERAVTVALMLSFAAENGVNTAEVKAALQKLKSYNLQVDFKKLLK